MSLLDTLLEAARYLEMQEQKQKQATPPKHVSPLPPITVATPLHMKGADEVVSQAMHHIQAPVPQRVIRNSFDIINPLVIDEAGEMKRKQPPMVFRSGTREVHNKLEKYRRAHLKECFDMLKQQLPATSDEKKTSNLTILHSAIKCIQNLKKEEREFEHEMELLAREKIALQQKLAILKKDGPFHCEADFASLLPDIGSPDSRGALVDERHLVVREEVLSSSNETLILADSSAPEPMDVQLSISNDLKITKSITRSLPVVTAASINGIKEGVLPQTTQVQTTALSVLPIGYPMNQGLVLQKVLVPKGITDLSQLVTSPPVAHFIATPQQLGGKVMPLMNQYVVKPLVVVSTPSRPS